MLKFLSGTVTQGSADAFATASLATGLAGLNQGYRVRRIELAWTATLVETDAFYQAEISRRLPTAILALTDRRSLFYDILQVSVTTSGAWVRSNISRYDYPRDLDLMIVEDPLYISVDSNGTSAANPVTFRIYYEEVRMTDLAKLAALQESTNA